MSLLSIRGLLKGHPDLEGMTSEEYIEKQREGWAAPPSPEPPSAPCPRLGEDGHADIWRCNVCEADEPASARERPDPLRTRPDYNFRCDRCGAPHNLDTSIPSDKWNAIMPDGGALCTLCIDDLLAEKGLTARAEFYFGGKALRGKSYTESQGEVEYLQRHERKLEKALRNIEALLCDKPLCGHFTAEEIRAAVRAAIEPERREL